MAKKQEQVDKIVENEPVVINEKDIISEEVKENDVIDVDAPEVIIEAKAEEEAKAEAEEKAKAEEEAKAKAEAEEKAKAEEEAKAKAEAEKKKTDAVKLRVLIGFTDKYTKQDYAVNDEIYVDKDRAKELLANEKRLVEKLD
jgi:membrane protein involved in colicin uptake